MKKITIIGSGSVGSTIAYTLMIQGLANEICMIDINSKKAYGEALDIQQGTPFCTPCRVYSGEFSDAVKSDIVIITSGAARKPGMSRLDLAQTNIDILNSITPEITKYAPEATYIIVSNPVDVLTYAFCKNSGIPEERIIGSGTILDTARLRARLSKLYGINERNVHAYVMGEHGDSSFVPWSLANISNIPIAECSTSIVRKDGKTYPDIDFDIVEKYVRNSGARVILDKGATFYAVSASVCHICRSLMGGIDTPLTVSTMLHGEYGIDDVCLSLLNVVGREGATSKLLLPLTNQEIYSLRQSAECLKEIIRNVKI
ncbi:MAG: L-lactate dehydrogenase [Clostridia bacterium]|nr:L-lactate dehydrogenase [Clostridia bacterium]